MEQKQYNMTFCILSALAIIMVVAGHVGYNIMTVGELFPYYSFHIPLFMFISGYFYKESEEKHPLLYLKKKICRLLVPYFIWNLVYGIIAWLMRGFGFSMGEGIGFQTLFIAPFLHGYQFIYNYAAWFVPVLFVVEMMNLAARLILSWITKPITGASGRRDGGREGDASRQSAVIDWVMLVGSLLVGMAVVWLAIGGHVWGYYKAPGKILFLFPCFQMGRFYRTKLEKHDTLGNLPYFVIVVGIQVLLNLCCYGLAYSSVWCTGFANGPVIPYVTAVSGIAFWQRIARVLTPIMQNSKAVRYLGRNTYAVMMHHVLVFMIIKTVIALIAASTGLCGDFDFAQFYTNIDYYYFVRGAEQFKMVYLALGVIVPLGIQYGLSGLGKRIVSKRRN
ncbi:MAG: acyltransferase family protein [Lachnospiraceae bacterium]|nr:acyltransferase family protein [Lachnospiraceae bacterium]